MNHCILITNYNGIYCIFNWNYNITILQFTATCNGSANIYIATLCNLQQNAMMCCWSVLQFSINFQCYGLNTAANCMGNATISISTSYNFECNVNGICYTLLHLSATVKHIVAHLLIVLYITTTSTTHTNHRTRLQRAKLQQLRAAKEVLCKFACMLNCWVCVFV